MVGPNNDAFDVYNPSFQVHNFFLIPNRTSNPHRHKPPTSTLPCKATIGNQPTSFPDSLFVTETPINTRSALIFPSKTQVSRPRCAPNSVKSVRIHFAIIGLRNFLCLFHLLHSRFLKPNHKDVLYQSYISFTHVVDVNRNYTKTPSSLRCDPDLRKSSWRSHRRAKEDIYFKCSKKVGKTVVKSSVCRCHGYNHVLQHQDSMESIGTLSPDEEVGNRDR